MGNPVETPQDAPLGLDVPLGLDLPFDEHGYWVFVGSRGLPIQSAPPFEERWWHVGFLCESDAADALCLVRARFRQVVPCGDISVECWTLRRLSLAEGICGEAEGLTLYDSKYREIDR